MISTTLAALTLLAVSPPEGTPGEKLPKGPPWHVTYREAKRDAMRHGRPVFVYFTKTY